MPIVPMPNGPFQPEWPSLEKFQVPEWYLDAKFGIFIHWGVYAVPAFGSEWYPRHMYLQDSKEFKHHVETYGPQTEFGYKDFIPEFKAEKFDAAAWAKLFKEAGAKYVVPVAEHHDGFAMYATKQNKWNAVEMGPKRDVIGELAEAVKAEGMVFGVSSHRAEHWWFLDGGRAFPSDVQDEKYRDFYGPAQPENSQPDEPFMDDWLARCAEIIDQYQPQLFWFDWWIEQPVFRPYLKRFAAYYFNRAYQWGKGVAINYKKEAFPPSAGVFDMERGQLGAIQPHFWQTDTAVVKNSWCYVKDRDYKTSESIIQDLIDIVSKNGCLLLNIGPKADGTIPEEDEAVLREIGTWLGIYGEAIYGTRPWATYGEGPTQVIEGEFQDVARAPFTGQDFRFTTKGEKLYAIGLANPPDGVANIHSLGSNMKLAPHPVATVSMLGGGPVSFEQGADSLTVRLPSHFEGPAYALEITFHKPDAAK